MKYMGSKRRIAKQIIPIMAKARNEGQWWVEPFVGGANIIDKVGGLRLGSDSNRFLVALLNEMQKDDFEAPMIDEAEYLRIKYNQGDYDDWIVGFAGFQLSFGSKFMDSYSRDRAGMRNYAAEAKRNVDAQSKLLDGIVFKNCDYRDLDIPAGSLIYCDPPYINTTTYGASFDNEAFWCWCLTKAGEGHTVFVSEQSSPEGVEEVWSSGIAYSVNKSTVKRSTEKLFRVHKRV
jgi:DNA adenine methylase